MALPKLSTPIYETKLLSTGQAIKFRPFLIKEQKLFLMASQSEDPKDAISSIKQVLTNCILDDINVDKLASFDLEYLFLQLRAKSVGEIVNLKYTCNNKVVDDKGEEKSCGNIVKFDVNLLEITPDVVKEGANKIQLTENLGVCMNYPDFDMLSKIEINQDQDIFQIVLNCIDYIYDKDEIYYAKDTPKEELVEFLENMQQADFEKIENFFKTMPKISKKLDFKCKKCGYSETMVVEGIQSFFG